MKKLLIIDDEFIFRQGLRYMMDWESCGYTIVGEASNGQEGLDIVSASKPDLVLCDIVMPIMNGVDFVRKLKERQGPPVIMLSNFDEFDKVRLAFQYGASDYLLKNRVTKESLLKCLEKIFFLETSSEKSSAEKTFESLVRQVLDGYAQEPFEKLQAYLSNRLPAKLYSILYVHSPQPYFQTSYHMQEYIENLAQTLDVCCAFTTQNHGICLIGSLTDSDSLDQTLFLSKLEEQHLPTSCVLCEPFQDFSIFRSKSEYLSELSNFSILFDDQRCFYECELSTPESEAPTFPLDSYTLYATGHFFTKACNILFDYIDLIKNSTTMNPFQFKKFVEHTFYIALQQARRTSEEKIELNKIEIRLLKALDQAVSLGAFRTALRIAYNELALLCRSNNTVKQNDSLIWTMYKYLNEHYHQQITLYDIAEYLHMNYSYLSSYISQHTKKHFTEHLNDIRIKYAKQLLAETDRSICSISESIGYSDQSYFGKMFKKQTGVTPLQYRNTAHGRNLYET